MPEVASKSDQILMQIMEKVPDPDREEVFKLIKSWFESFVSELQSSTTGV